MASGSEVCTHVKVPKAYNLFHSISLRASLEPGSTLVGKGEKKSCGRKKKRIDKRSQLRGSLGRGKGGVHHLAHFDRLYFSYLTPFFPFFPHCGAWSQANLIIKTTLSMADTQT